jgi:hypothetical protein
LATMEMVNRPCAVLILSNATYHRRLRKARSCSYRLSDLDLAQYTVSSLSQLATILEKENREELASYISALSPADTALAISRVTQAEQTQVMRLLNPSDAAEVIEKVPNTRRRLGSCSPNRAGPG